MTARTKAAGKSAAKTAKSPKTESAPAPEAATPAPAPNAPVDAALWNLAERLIATPEPHPQAAHEAPAPRATFPRPQQQQQPPHAAPPVPGAPGTMPSASRVRLVRLPNGQTVAVPFNPQTGMPELSSANLAALQQAAAQQRAANLAPPAQPQPQQPQPASMFDHAAPMGQPQAPASAPVRPFTLTPPPPAPGNQGPGGFSMLSQSFQGERPAPEYAAPPAPRFAAEQPAPAPGKAAFSILRSRTEDAPRPAPAARPAALADTLPSAAPSAAPADDDEWDDADRPGISILGWLGVAVAVGGAAVVACVFQGWI